MNEMVTQKKLADAQIEAFYHDEFVEDQVRDFGNLNDADSGGKAIVDIGGGCGFFARSLSDVHGYRTRVLDMDTRSVAKCHEIGVDAELGDALAPVPTGDEDVVCFNLILHHLVGKNEAETRRLQLQALKAWHGKARRVFVNEYIYQSFVPHLSGRWIFEITSSSLLSAVGSAIGKVVPALRANTFGVGVRFRSNEQWRELFAEAGYKVVGHAEGKPEPISPPLRGLLIKTIRRDSYLLEPIPAA